MITRLAIVPVIVKDLDEAFKFYTEKLDFEKVTDVKGPMHFLTVAPKGRNDTEILLQVPDAKIVGEEKAAEMMSQIGTTSFIFEVDDCKSTVEELRKNGVQILMEPQTQPYGTQAMIADLYGNSFVLREPPK